ncbi:MAG: BTAD domain-containing putative transcriptional regulator [Acidimicrobiia bacterium]
MAGLTINLLGPPVVESDGIPIEVDTRKAVALLAYLAVTGRAETRDSLSVLLWPDNDHSRGRAALRRTLSVLRKALDHRWLVIEGQTVALPIGSDMRIDVRLFEDRLAATKLHPHPASAVCNQCLQFLEEAVAQYRGDFLTGFTLRDSANFDDWQLAQGEHHRREFTGALRDLTDSYRRLGRSDDAIAALSRWLEADPLVESAHRSLMEVYASAGDRSRALEQYQKCIRVLDRELGVSPLEETVDLYHELKVGRIPVRAKAQPTKVESLVDSEARPPSRLRAPLVGRASDLETVSVELARGNRLIAIEGEAGIGKTRLAEEVLAAAAAQGITVIAAHCHQGEEDLAFGVLAELLTIGGRAEDARTRLASIPSFAVGEASSLAPSLGDLVPAMPPHVPLSGAAADARLLDGVAEALRALCGEGGVLFIDDVQWADAASLKVLGYMVRRLPESGPSILVTSRTEALRADHPLHEMLHTARRNGASASLSLARLDRDEVAELVTAASPHAAAQPDLDILFEETEGVPFFVVEYLDAFRLDGEIDSGRLPVSVRDLLSSKLAGLTEMGRQVAATASVVGRAFDLDLVREVSGRSPEEVVEAVEELCQRGVLGAPSGDSSSFDFAHDKLKEVVYEDTNPARRRLLHRRVASALVGVTRSGTAAPSAEVARHYQLAGDDAEAAAHYLEAGRRAFAMHANTQAKEYLLTALALGHTEEGSIHREIGDIELLAGDYQAALSSYERAAAMSSPDARPDVERRLGALHHRTGQFDSARAYFQTARDSLVAGERTAAASMTSADWALTEIKVGNLGRARFLAEEAMELALLSEDSGALAQGHNTLGILATEEGDYPGAAHHLEQGLAMADEVGGGAIRVAALNNLARATARIGDLDRGRALAEAALEESVAIGDRHREAALHNNLADLLHATGDVDESMKHLKKALQGFAEIELGADLSHPEIWKLAQW